ncbi:unnamed protein product [Miscanthus lutarioriparius]|uniref:Cathepsin propeptide inhibitor domain-containing protein n=1 Tax=Miscanthus lutarioriparius TaxID=422564 RepID=A0A811N2J1_9POAL|nr:unnamed protein product [Miscanthus lutarioriparius]
MGGVVLAAAVLLAPVVAVGAAPLVPVTDKDLESDASMWNLYERWCSVYSSGSPDLAEKARKFETFKANARHINEFNKREDVPYKLGLNQFSDLTEEEFDSGMYTGALPEDAGNVSSGMTDDDKLLA